MLTIRLPRPFFNYPKLATLIAAETDRRVSSRMIAAFALCPDEFTFCKELNRRKSNFWIFRTNQHRFCGDFVVVDMSASCPQMRSAWVIDLKLGAELQLGGGGAGVAFRNAQKAVDSTGISSGVFEKVVGDSSTVLAYLVKNNRGPR